MTNAKEMKGKTCDYTMFTLNIDDKIYHCPVSTEALYMICRDQDCSIDQIDAYLQLKMKVQQAMQRRLTSCVTESPAPLESSDFTR